MQSLHEESGYGIRWMCGKLGISKAAYYKWKTREIPDGEKENVWIAEKITEYDERYGHILGYRRMTEWINRNHGKHYNVKRIRRLMKILGIASMIRRKKTKYVHSAPEETADNLLGRNFYAEAPNRKWVTDVTEFKWYEGKNVHKIYLSAIIDLYDRSVIAYKLSRRNDNKLVIETFDEAMKQAPGSTPILHSDRGYQYTSKAFRRKLLSANVTQSMSRAGHCIDNGPCEGYWGIIKAEMYHLRRFHSEEELCKAIEDFIHFYNYERFQSRYGGKTPMEVRMAALGKETPEQYPIPVNKRIEAFKSKYSA